jgi:hypothetical protein
VCPTYKLDVVSYHGIYKTTIIRFSFSGLLLLTIIWINGGTAASFNTMQAETHVEDTATERTLHDLLKINHDSFDIVFDGYKVNHMVHHLYVLYAMGGK